MRRPFRAEADATLLLVSGANRPWSNRERLVSRVAQMSISSLFCQLESSMIDFAKALPPHGIRFGCCVPLERLLEYPAHIGEEREE